MYNEDIKHLPCSHTLLSYVIAYDALCYSAASMPSNEGAAKPTIYGPNVERNDGTINATYNFAEHAYDVRVRL